MTGAWHAPVSMADKESVDVRSEVHRPQERIAPQGARVLLMDGTAVESAFVTFDKSNKTALTGMNTIYVMYLALFRECEVKK